MLKGLQITALVLTLASLLGGISTNIAHAQQSTEQPIDIVGDTKTPQGDTKTPQPGDIKTPQYGEKCNPVKKCPNQSQGGNTPSSPANSEAPTSTT